MNHSASNTTDTAAGTTNETNETSNETIDSTLTANSAPKSIKLPIVFIFPLEKVTYELKEFLNKEYCFKGRFVLISSTLCVFRSQQQYKSTASPL